MKYECLHTRIFKCPDCGLNGRWLFWWNRRNGNKAIFRRLCHKCGRKRKYKFIGLDVEKINLGMNGRIFYLKDKNRKHCFLMYLGHFFSSPFNTPKKYRG